MGGFSYYYKPFKRIIKKLVVNNIHFIGMRSFPKKQNIEWCCTTLVQLTGLVLRIVHYTLCIILIKVNPVNLCMTNIFGF